MSAPARGGAAPVLKLDRYVLSTHDFGGYRLDGGAMFGSVPKALWAGLIPPDPENRIRLATRSLVVRGGGRTLLLDVGCGDKWSEKLRRIYGVEPDPRPGELDPDEVTDVVLTHLHFDHAGGLSRWADEERTAVVPRYRRARVHLQAANLETARRPNVRERASYLRENVAVLEQAPLELADGTREIAPGVRVHRSDGHTRGLQWIEVRDGGRVVVYPSDLVPTARHLPLPYAMGYDMAVETLLAEKDAFLRRAVEEDWIVVFVHDPEIPAATVRVDERGAYAVRDAVAL